MRRSASPRPFARSVLLPALALLLPALGLASPTVEAQERRPMVPEDYHRLAFVSDPRVSPDGSEVVFVLRRVSDDRRGRDGALWIVPTDGAGEPRPLTTGTRDASPRWAPNGTRIAYLDRARSGGEAGANEGTEGGASENDASGTRLRILPREGGEATTVLHLRQGSVQDFQWTRDGRVLLTLDLDPGVSDPRQPAPPRDPGAPDLTVVRDAVYQAEGQGFLGPEREHLWLLDPTVGAFQRVTPGDARWNDAQATLSPDGRTVVFQRDGSGEEYDGGFERGLWLLDLDAPAGSEPIPFRLPAGRAEAPVWSPDGSDLLYRFRPGRYARAHLQLAGMELAREEEGGAPRTLTLDVDRAPQNFFWHPSGRHLYFTADWRGTHPLYRMAANGADVRPLFGEDGVVSSPTISADGRRLVFLYENEVNPPEIWTADADGLNVRPLTAFNRELLEELALNRVEEFDFLNGEEVLLQGFFVRPVGWEEGARYPMVLNIKGGPGGMWGRRWFPEFQVLSGAGYAVTFVNYRGSPGYGHAFQSAVRRDYGGPDARDNLRLVEEAVSRFGWVDPARLFVTGGSHGGFLTNWLTTETDRFRAAVTQRSVSNWISEAGTQAYPPRAMREEFGGTIWENYPLYWERSPLSRADRVRTPTLVIHSDQDVITPLGQGQEWYFALKALGVPTEMVVFHGEGHELSRSGTPVNLVERKRRILDWFARWDEGGRGMGAPEGGAGAGR